MSRVTYETKRTSSAPSKAMMSHPYFHSLPNITTSVSATTNTSIQTRAEQKHFVARLIGLVLKKSYFILPSQCMVLVPKSRMKEKNRARIPHMVLLNSPARRCFATGRQKTVRGKY